MTKSERLSQLESFTTPNMRGFFPDQTAGRKSKTLTFFDTETDDRSRVLTIAAHKVVFNYDKLRFENADDSSGFFRVYNPVNVDKNIVRTEGKHGLFSEALAKMRARSGANYSSNWDLSQYEEFKKWVGDSELAGHNIVAADIPWILKPTGRDFNINTYKKGFFDTLHYAKGIVGNESAALQDLRQKYSTQLKGLNLEAHEASGDVVLNIKVLETMIRSNLKNPLTAEALYAFGLKGVQTGWKQPLNLEEGQGQLIYGARGKPLHNLPYRNAKKALKGWSTTTGFDNSETYVLDLKEAFNIPQDVYDTALGTSAYLASNYSEGPIGSGNMDKEILEQYKNLFERYQALDADKIKPHTNIGQDEDSRRAVRAFRQLFSTSGQGWDDQLINIPDHVAASMTAVFRSMGYNPSERDVHNENSIYQRYARRALEENAHAWWQKQVNYNTTVGNLLAKDKAMYADQDWWQQLAGLTVYEVSPAAIETYKSAKKDYLKKQKQAKAEQRASEKARQRQASWAEKTLAAADQAYESAQAKMAQDEEDNAWQNYRMAEAIQLDREREQAARTTDVQKARKHWGQNVQGRGDFTKAQQYELLLKTAQGTEKYAEALKKVSEQNERVTKGAHAWVKALKMFSPGELFKAANAEIKSVMDAGHGLLPEPLETPIQRYAGAITNGVNIAQAQTMGSFKRWSAVSDMAGAAAVPIFMANPLAGAAVGMVSGAVKLGTNIVGENYKEKITTTGEGIALRLNMLNAAVQLAIAPLKLFGTGLRTANNLFARLTKIWGTQYGFPLTALTKVSSAHYGNMLIADNAFGLKQGSTNSMHNTWAEAQVGLYGLGQFDENRLIASALTGTLNSVYSPYGGKQEEQIAETVNHITDLIRSGDDSDKQYYMAMAKRIDPNLPNMIQTMLDYGMSDYRQFQDGSYISGLGVYRRAPNESERRRFRQTNDAWSASRQETQYELSRIGVPLWGKVGLPTMNFANKLLASIADSLNAGAGISFENIKNQIVAWKDEILKNLGLENVDWKAMFTTVGDLIKEPLVKVFSDIATTLVKLMMNAAKSMTKPIAELIDGMKNIHFDKGALLNFFFNGGDLGSVISYAPAQVVNEVEKTNWSRGAYLSNYQIMKDNWSGGRLVNSENRAILGSWGTAINDIDIDPEGAESLENWRRLLAYLNVNHDKYTWINDKGALSSFIRAVSKKQGYRLARMEGLSHTDTEEMVGNFFDSTGQAFLGTVDEITNAAQHFDSAAIVQSLSDTVAAFNSEGIISALDRIVRKLDNIQVQVTVNSDTGVTGTAVLNKQAGR